MNPFIKNAEAEVSKTEKQIARENAENFLETAAIECELNITTIKIREIPTVEMAIKKQNSLLKKSQENFQKVRYTTASSFEQYVSNRQYAEQQVQNVQNELTSLNNKLNALNKELEKFESIFEDLTSK